MLLKNPNFPEDLKKNKVYSFIGFVNFLKISIEILQKINWVVDGSVLSLIFKFQGVNTKKNSFDFSGVADIIFKWVVENNYKIHFIGGSKTESTNFKKIIKAKYPIINISTQDGYDSLKEFSFKSLSDVNICVYGLGSPNQEILAIRNKHNFDYSFTCGAFITQTAKSGGEYYPVLVHKLNLRWLYRMLNEKNHFKRTFMSLLLIPKIYKKIRLIIEQK